MSTFENLFQLSKIKLWLTFPQNEIKIYKFTKNNSYIAFTGKENYHTISMAE